jgi:Ca2+-binding EF-hand superfamily protein
MPAVIAQEPMRQGPSVARAPAVHTLALLAAICLFGTAWADEQPSAPDAPALFTQLDSDSDGFVTRDEVAAEKQGLLRRLLRISDANKDGKLDRDEFVAGLKSTRPQRRSEPLADTRPEPGGFDPAAMFRRMDANGDGIVTLDEIPSDRREGFAGLLSRADTNGDGKLSRDEFDKARSLFAGRFGRGSAQNDPNDRPESAPAASAVFLALDRDGDGRLSADEIRNSPDSLAALDKNGDGSIAADELGRAPARPSAAAGFDPARVWRRLQAGDKNNDGRLSADELPERFQRAFGRLDGNNDGFVDESEFKTGLEQMRGAVGKPPAP